MACLTVLLVSVSSWERRSVLRLSCVVAVCLPLSFAYRLARRLVSRLVGRGVMFVSPFRLVSRLGERGGFVFWFYPGGSGWAAVLVSSVSGLSRCLLVLMPSGDGAMPFSSSTFPPISYHPMATWYGFRAVSFIWFIVVCFLFSVGYRSCLVPSRSIRGGRNGRRDGCLLGYRGVAR